MSLTSLAVTPSQIRGSSTHSPHAMHCGVPAANALCGLMSISHGVTVPTCLVIWLIDKLLGLFSLCCVVSAAEAVYSVTLMFMMSCSK